MTYTLPSKQELVRDTKNLLQKFIGFSELYYPPDYKTTRDSIGKLEDDYKVEVAEKASKQWRLTKAAPEQIRLDQIACVVQLSQHLPVFENEEGLTEDGEAKLKQSHMILLGALFYRYLRIEDSYKGGITGSLGVFGSADNSALKVVLHKLLGITTANVLDKYTIASCCKEYRTYLKLNNNGERYSYIKKNTDFFYNLDAIILDAEQQSKVISDQIPYILFVKSVPAFLNRYEKIFTETAFEQLRSLLIAKLKEKTSLDYLDIQDSIKKLNLDQSLKDFFVSRFLHENMEITAETLDNFKTEVTKNMDVFYKYALVGAYAMCIEKCKPSSPDGKPSALCRALQSSIDVNVDNPLDNERKKLALSALKQLVDLSNDLPLNPGIWGTVDLFKRELSNQLDVAKNCKEEEQKVAFSI